MNTPFMELISKNSFGELQNLAHENAFGNYILTTENWILKVHVNKKCKH